ncbi:S8 family serine peptidase [Kribbella sp. NPDC023855]|uniref:S8 family peptidase n=1 Tax=Kribbella sp. NPDC023855 TaxID=3154698 RepID=UPI0033D2DDC3
MKAALVLTAALAASALLPNSAAQRASAAAVVPAAIQTTSTTPPKNRAVTLITGDQVVLLNGNPNHAVVRPAPGRAHVSFESRRTANKWTVVPSDVRDAINRGTLDPRLFELNGLLRDGYDDTTRTDIPLLITHRTTRAKPANATITATLPALNGLAVRVPKSKATAFLKANPNQKIWLDGKLRTTLDHSVPQIGAPAAWQSGYTGKGVKIAVLDSGIDSTHPDLAGQVTASANFTDEPLDDAAGHGTHVASTIAGKGVDGYRGVAPDAKLLNGKVCDAHGYCPESAILAGLEWAVAQHANVVNLSLGGPGSEGLDPLEEAVDRLTRQTGTLFVVAAGNEPGKARINSPGSAESALTVGAVNAQEQLADFSSQGPGPGGAIKPDLTAPGVGIVAARSAASHPEDPVGDKYTRMSGTSMATPHVTGTAALVAQQHADWKAPELKSALMAAAKPAADLTAYKQGAGRVDAARAVTQSVIAETLSISFGTALWPHADDKPVAKQLVYRNLGTTAVTLDLRTETATADQPAPTQALTLSTHKLAIPAGGKASLQVTSDTSHNGPDGLYDGRIVATAGQQQLVTPIVVDKEVESYNLTITHLARDGKPTPSSGSWLWNLATGDFYDSPVDVNGKETVRLPRGSYLLQATIGGAAATSQLVQPKLEIDGHQTLVADARQAKPVDITVSRKGAKPYLTQSGFHRSTPDGPWLSLGQLFLPGNALFLGRLGDPVPEDQLTSFVMTSIGAPGADGEFVNSPYTYNLLDTRRGSPFDGLTRRVSDRSLAHVASTFHGNLATPDAAAIQVVSQPNVRPPLGVGFRMTLPAKVDQYYEPGATEWTRIYQDESINLSSPAQRFRAGTTHQRWNAAVHTPGFAGQGSAVRTGDALKIHLFSHNDPDGHAGTTEGTAVTKLSRAGELVAESPEFGKLEVTGQPPAQYRLETSTGTTSVTATFRSTTDGPLPLRFVRFHPAVDRYNQLPRKPTTVLPFTYDTQPGTPPLKNLVIEYSPDGQTWKRASTARARAIFSTPPRATQLSLRATVTDVAGDTTTQTTLDALKLR